MNLLLIEDEPDFVEKVARACTSAGVTLFTPEAANLKGLVFLENAPLEDQLVLKLRDLVNAHQIDLVFLDSDLSRAQRELRTQSEYRLAFQNLGVPVCRYKKGQSTTKLAALEELRKWAREASSAVHMPKSLLDGDLTELVDRLEKVAAGFAELTERLRAQPDVLKSPLGPAGILADVLGRPELKSDFLGYTAQNSQFFTSGSESADRDRLYATQLGYWLLNYVLAFPGPILNPIAAAAYLNLQPASFELPEVQKLVASARYAGPFGSLGFYWKEDLAQIIDECHGDIAQATTLAKTTLARVDPETPEAIAYYCVLDAEAIKESDAAPVNPDWIPPGATLSRIKESELDELGPMLKI